LALPALQPKQVGVVVTEMLSAVGEFIVTVSLETHEFASVQKTIYVPGQSAEIDCDVCKGLVFQE